jgi:hypothetical protein
MDNLPSRIIFCIAMVLLTVVSIYTTYASLNDSILPEPKVAIPITEGVVWQCSVMALGLAVAIGLMLFALKLSIIGGHKRLNILGVVGMTIVAFISIAFNVDVLYRTADRDFYIRYSNDKMRSTYEKFLGEAQGVLGDRRTELLRSIAKQEGELDSEVKGLRKAPAGYGTNAKEEDYKLNVLQKTAQVDLQAVEEALATKKEADTLLRGDVPQTLADIDKMQAQLRVIVKDLSGISGVPLPELVKTENPLFAVFEKLFDYKSVGFKEIFILITAFLLDLGDIIGYSLVPGRKPEKKQIRIEPFPEPRLALLASDDQSDSRALEPIASGGSGGARERVDDGDDCADNVTDSAASYNLRTHRRRTRFRF